jgi:4-hydroxybenzoate polyprenyltransferase
MSGAAELSLSGPAVVASPPTRGVPTSELPLCVDLDGTLLRSDALVEGVLAAATDWRILPALADLVRRGRAALKERIASIAPLDPELLPYNAELIEFLRREKARGRRIVLATAADARVAGAIAAHLQLFDEVIASDGQTNLKGGAKAQALAVRFGEKGFVYAGNDETDLAVWRLAAAAIVVNAPAAVAAKVRAEMPVEAEIRAAHPQARALLRAMRPQQWVKNILVFIPILTAHALNEPAAWIGAGLAFAAFCATASSIYLVNDLLDLAADRRHPRKRTRPFASGEASLGSGISLSLFLLLGGLALGAASGALLIVGCYAAMSLGYSLKLKEQPLVDVFMLAGLYTIRIVGGGEASGHPLSLWLLGFSGFLFLSLALVKRVEEGSSLLRQSERSMVRRAYSVNDIAILQSFGIASSFASSLVLALYVQAEASAQQYASPVLLWGTVPLILFWQCRLWLSTARGYMHDDPIVYAARDWVSWLVAICVAGLLVIAKSSWF